MNDSALHGVTIQATILDAACDAVSAAFVIYDRDDRLLFVSRRIFALLPLKEEDVVPGVRLKDFLCILYERTGLGEANGSRQVEKDEWIAEKLAAHWKERSETVEHQPGDKWLRFTKRRTPSGLGICVISDITEQKKREDRWRSDIERVQVTEEILDNLPLSIFVKDSNRIYSAINKAGCSLIETSPDFILGRTVFDIHSNPLAASIDQMDKQVLETGDPVIFPERVTRLTGEELFVITRKHRVGKPGRYFLVTTMEDVTAFTVTDADGRRFVPELEHLSFVVSSYMDDENHQASLVLKGRRVLLVTSNTALGNAACRRLSAVGVDCAAVASLEEQEAFIDISSSMGLKIDLVVVDVGMPLQCLDLPASHAFDVLTVDEFQMKSSLLNLVTHHFRSMKSVSTEERDGTADRQRLDVLVVEDNKINQIVFSQILEGLQIDYKLAQTGEEALRLFASERPMVVLMDTTLPDVDGFDVTRRIRHMEASSGARTPIVGIVPLAFEGDRKACAEAGMDDMLLKPVSPDIIDALMKRFLPLYDRQLHG